LAAKSRRARESPGPKGRATPPSPPSALKIARAVAPGRHPLLSVFHGLDRTPGFRSLPAPPLELRRVVRGAHVIVVPGRGWMHVAPRVTPPEIRRYGYEMMASSGEAIVVGGSHHARSPALVLYLDIIHEFLHLLQRARDRDLWPAKVPYVDRPTELEAYRHSLKEARRLGADDDFLREYLKVEWISPKEFERLLRHLGVGLGTRRSRKLPRFPRRPRRRAK
jgi:hypothetical protein